MPDDIKPQGPQQTGPSTPFQPQNKSNSLDGFTNSPKPMGSPATISNTGDSAINSVGSQLQQPSSPFSNGGVTKPTVTGMTNVPQVTNSAFTPPPPDAAPIVKKSKSHKKLWVGLSALIVLLLLAGGYVFAFYLPNTPSHVYKASLTNTGLAVDKLLDNFRQQQQAHYKSSSFDGKLAVASGSGSFDANINGDISDTDGQVQMSGDAMGNKVSANIKYVTKSGNKSPDVYAQVSGVKKFLDQVGMTKIAAYDGKWILIDHTLIDTYKSGLQEEAQTFSDSQKADMNKLPTATQVDDAIGKVQAVNKQYIFTSDSSKAVLTKNQYMGKESINGRSVYHYKVGYNKDHLKAYVTAVGQALDSSQLNDWAKKVDGGKNISDEMGFNNSGKSIDNLKSDYTFDMWSDVQTKLITKLSFADPSNASDTFSFSQGYTGGVVYPMSFGFSSKDTNGSTASGTFGISLNSATNKESVTLKVNSKDSSGTTSVDGNFNITPSNKEVVITAPAGAKPLSDVLKTLGINPNMLNPSTILGTTSGPTGAECPSGSYMACTATPQQTLKPSSAKCPANADAATKAVCARYGLST